MKPGHKTITPFGIKVMSKYKVLSKRERGVTKKFNNSNTANEHMWGGGASLKLSTFMLGYQDVAVY